MQSQSNTPFNNINSQQQNSRKRLILVVIIIVSTSILILYSLSLFLSKDKKPLEENKANQTNEYYDPGSGETVSNPPDRTPETYGVDNNEPIFLGTSRLLDFGVTKYQLEDLKNAFMAFSKTKNNDVKEVSISVNTIKNGPDIDEQTRSVTFDTTINRNEKYQAELHLVIIQKARLILRQGGKEVFRSELLTPYSGESGY